MQDGNGYRLVKYRGVWSVYWRELDGEQSRPRRHSLRTSDQSEGRQRFKDFLKAQALPSSTVGAIYEAYRKDKGFTHKSDRSAAAWKSLKGQFADLREDQVTKEECRKFITKRRKSGVGDGTIRRELGILRAALYWNNKASPAVFELPSAPAPRELYLTREQYQKLLDSAFGNHIRLFIVLALATAGRASAILELTWDRVDFQRGIIKLARGGEERRKGRATVPMTQTARTELEEAQRAAETDHVIEYGGKRVISVRKGLGRAAKRAGLPGVTPHVLRHTAAVWMAERGVPMPEIAQYLGHTDTRITERVYARYSPEYLRKAASALEV